MPAADGLEVEAPAAGEEQAAAAEEEPFQHEAEAAPGAPTSYAAAMCALGRPVPQGHHQLPAYVPACFPAVPACHCVLRDCLLAGLPCSAAEPAEAGAPAEDEAAPAPVAEAQEPEQEPEQEAEPEAAPAEEVKEAAEEAAQLAPAVQAAQPEEAEVAEEEGRQEEVPAGA